MKGAPAPPVPHWFCQDYDEKSMFKILRWMPYDDTSSQVAEEAYNTMNRNTKVILTSRNTVLSIKRMTERDCDRTMMDKIKGQSRDVRRGTWFYHEEDNEWAPYDTAQALSLEDAYRNGNFKNVEVSKQPHRFVLCDSSGEFRQYRLSKNANTDGRLVIRGYDRLLEYLATKSQSLPSSPIHNHVH